MNPFPADTAPALAAVLAPVRRQRAAWVLAVGLPWLPAAAAAAWRLAGPGIGLGVAATAAAILAARIAWALRALDAAWLVRRLDAHDPRFEDSSALLLEPADRLHPLLRLQRERVRVRLARGTHPDLRRAWPARRLLAGGTGAALVVAAALAWPPAALPGLAPASRAAVRTRSPVPVTLRDAHLHVTPPAYTAMPDRDVDGLDARVPEASRLRWRLRFDPQPAGVALHFHDGRRLALRRDGADWVADATLRKPALYRIVAAHAGAAAVQPDRPHRIDVDADRAPRLRVTRPGQTLTASGDGLRHWQLAFEGIDDHGVSPRAALRIITARGSGEAVTFDAVDRTLTGTGPARRRAFRHTVDVAALGLGAGDELIVRFSVADNRPGRAQRVDSPSYILRWPSQEASTVSAIDGMVKTVLPAYFRSQRQIIIDAEALLKQKPRLETDTFAARSDAIGVDQRLLRLRYGQFLGEETEGAPRRPLMPTNDAEDEAAAGAPPAVADAPHAGAGVATVAAADAPQAGPGIAAVPVEAAAATLAHAGGAHVDASSDTPMARSGADVPGSDGDGDAHDGHAHGGVEDAHAAAPAFGAASDVLAEFGHTHDHAEAATLLDPATRRTLKSALDAMWESERMLRQ
ncbi:MAG TPA: hypothetical protein VLK29_07915, partial [Luteimonas sp.]|nr:hypothetical protein [Luteimonas sp.]